MGELNSRPRIDNPVRYHYVNRPLLNSNVDLVANPEEEFIGFTSNVIDREVNASFPDTPLETWSG